MAGEFIERSRHGTVFYFRRRVPHDLRHLLGRRHIYVTLRTQERRTALLRARLLAVRTDALFEEVRRMPREKVSRFLDTDYNVYIDLDDTSGKPKKVSFTDVKSEDKDAVTAIAATLAGASGIQPARPTPTIREAIDDLVKSGEVGQRSLMQYLRALEGFATYFGETTQLAAINQDRFAEYAAHIMATDDWQPKTKNTIITTAARLFNRYAGRNSSVPQITTKGLKARRERPAGLDRDAVTIEELREIFANAARYRAKAPSKWWVSVVPAFLGCRIEELAQAHVASDFYRDKSTGAMVLKISEDSTDLAAPAKSVKTLAGWRRVPIHPVLVELGFIEFIQQQRADGYATPFAAHWAPWTDKKTGATIHSHYVVKWGGRELEKLRAKGKVERGGKLGYFHSMRHAFVTQLASAGIGEEWRAGLAGQAYGGVNAQVYNKARDDIAQTLPIIVRALAPLEACLRAVIAK